MPRILIIDDNEDLRGLLRELLERDGAEVFEAEDGEQGLERFKDCQPEMVIVDLLMPGKGGLEVLQELREKSHQARILVISGEGEDVTAAVRLGADGMLFKPFRNQEFMEKVHEILYLDRASGPGE